MGQGTQLPWWQEGLRWCHRCLALRGGTQTSFAYGCCNYPKLLGVWDIGLHAPLLPTACCKRNCFTCPFSVSDFNYPHLL